MNRKIYMLGLVVMACAVALAMTYPDLRRAWQNRELVREQIEANRLPGALLEAIRHDSKLALFSLDGSVKVPPSNYDPEAPFTALGPSFKGRAVVREVMVGDLRARQRLVATLEHVTTDGEPTLSLCFEPGHGLRARDQAGGIWELLICFDCHRIAVFTPDQKEVWSGMIKEATPGPFDELLRVSTPTAKRGK